MSERCRKFGGLFFAKIKHPLNLSCATRARFGDCQNYPLELRWEASPQDTVLLFCPLESMLCFRHFFLHISLDPYALPWATLPGDAD